MKITVLANHSVANVGDHAILQETLKLLDQSYPGSDITLVFNEPEQAQAIYTQQHVIRSAIGMMTTIDTQGYYHLASRSQRMVFIISMLWKTVSIALRSRRKSASTPEDSLLYAIADADLVLGCGGGYLCSDPDEIFGWFTLVLLPFMIAHILARPLVLLPQSIGPLPNIRQRLPSIWVLRHARLIIAREPLSLHFLEQLGVAQQAIPGPDMAFGMQAASSKIVEALFLDMGVTLDTAPRLIGITAINWEGQSQVFDRQARYEAALLGAVNHFTTEGAQVIFFPQCTGPSQAEDDRRVAARIMAQATHPAYIFQMPELDPALLQAAYGKLDFLIGTRMHSVILAANAGVPSVAIGYLPKTAGILQDMDLEQYALAIETVTSEQIVTTANAIISSEYKQRLTAYIAKALRFKRVLAELLRGIVS